VTGVPQNAIRALSDPVFQRGDATCVAAALERLGVTPGDCFREFFRRFTGGYHSESVGFLLLDLCDGAPSIPSQTADARDVSPLPPSCLVLTEMEGAAVLVYDCESDAVYTVDFEGADEDLSAGRLAPTWASFSAFLADFFA
jgi:hypothetical protein